MVIRSKAFLFVSVIVLLCIEAVLYFCFWKKNILIFPSQEYKTALFTDQGSDSGFSKIDTIHREKLLQVHYSLSDGYKWPFAGIRFLADESINCKSYDSLEIKVEVKEEQRQIVALWSAPVSVNNMKTTEQPTHFELALSPNKKSYSIPLSSFETPPWWLMTHKLSQSDIISDPMSRLIGVGIRSGYTPQIDREYSFNVISIRLTKDNGSLLITMVGIFVFGLAILFLVRLLPVKSPQQIYIPMKEVEQHQIDGAPLLPVIIKTIGDEFDNHTLSLAKVAEACSTTEVEVSQTIKNAFELSFKQYLNKVRMEHAIKLLEVSDYSIKEVCFKSGYQTTSHFFRIFRSFFNESPSEYRDRLNKSTKNS